MSRLGELLVREKLISLAQLQKAQDDQRKSGARLGNSLIKLGMLDEQELTNFLSKQYAVPSINLSDFEIPPDVLQLVPAELAKRHQLLPINRAGATLIVAMSDPSNIYAIDDLKFRTGLNIEVVVASEVAIDESIQRYYEKYVSCDDVLGDMDADSVEVGDSDDDVNVVSLRKTSAESPRANPFNSSL